MTRDEPFDQPAEQSTSAFKWKAVLGLAIVWTASITGAVWVWAALFIWWAIVDLWYGETHFFERVTRAGNPLTFWLIVLSWIGLSVVWVLWT